ncbi:hypothetical protein, variant 1 [Aphanomyces invadans]|uniref:Prolyl 4-hydroxylase alpha subunit domain-containing protein n=1 Tax=Aphanomyces invadans TaxID=157072 RepID=A0A024UE10_9STRA|nr:hypothetical protein, variant 1 [Aphanomyces invadans]ETW04499.1 hypothetical protein, variant 1 [Aphanomyces invadans]|eukprot:XP_008867455.1 hypothetical protein, variant 1 [Aphanomyces invadans]
MSKGASVVVGLLAVLLAIVYVEEVQRHPLYVGHVAPLVQDHVAPVYREAEAQYAKHLAPLVQKHVSPLYEAHVAPLVRSLVSLTQSSADSSAQVTAEWCNTHVAPHLTDVKPIEGFHVLCVDTSNAKISGWVYRDGFSLSTPVTLLASTTWTELKKSVEAAAEIAPPTTEHEIKFKQPWALFTPTGKRLWNFSEVAAHGGIVYVMEGGQFIWPGIRIGHKRVIPNLHGLGDVVLETLEMTPLVFSVKELLTNDEIDVILDLSMEHLAPSGVTHNDGDVGKPATEWRTSTTYFLSSQGHPVLEGIDQRVADLVKVPASFQEDVQVLRYELNQKYDAHLDYFSVERLTKNPAMVESLHHGFKNRMITVFWYMSDVPKGGHTVFPRAGGAPQPTDYTDCSKGLLSTPQKRKVIVFYRCATP